MNGPDRELSGWTKPQRQRTLAELRVIIAERQAELDALIAEAQELENEARLKAIAQARNIMRAFELTISDLNR